MSEVLNESLRSLLREVSIDSQANTASFAGQSATEEDSEALISRLGKFVYRIYHQGARADEESDQNHNEDHDFIDELVSAVPHDFCWEEGEIVEEGENGIVALLSGVRVRIPVAMVDTVRGRIVRLRLPPARRRVSPGYLLVKGTHGLTGGVDTGVLRIYLHLRSSHEGLRAWKRVLRLLEELGPAYQAKILSSPAAFPRKDALVVYLGSDHQRVVEEFLLLDAEEVPRGKGTSPFTHEMGDGMSVAWEEEAYSPAGARLSFGQHRSNILARALIDHAYLDPEAPVEAYVARVFADNGIDPLDPSAPLPSSPERTRLLDAIASRQPREERR